MLSQDNKPGVYASRSMTDAEIHYAQTEEVLAVLLTMEHFHQITYENEVNVKRDHKTFIQQST